MSNPFNPFQTRSALRFPPEAQEGRLPPSLLCYCPSPQPLPQDKIAAGNHAGRTRAALPVQFFPVFSTEHLWGRRYFRKTSWITFSCIRLNGPPLPVNPRRLAGTWAQYSKNASPQEKRMTRMSGQLVETFIS